MVSGEQSRASFRLEGRVRSVRRLVRGVAVPAGVLLDWIVIGALIVRRLIQRRVVLAVVLAVFAGNGLVVEFVHGRLVLGLDRPWNTSAST